jgi:hypothetical protein
MVTCTEICHIIRKLDSNPTDSEPFSHQSALSPDAMSPVIMDGAGPFCQPDDQQVSFSQSLLIIVLIAAVVARWQRRMTAAGLR